MKKFVITEEEKNNILGLYKLPIYESMVMADQELSQATTNALSQQKTPLGNFFDISLSKTSPNTIEVKPVGKNTFSNFQISFPGKSSFKIAGIYKDSAKDFVTNVELLNKDFPLNWGSFKLIQGVIKGYVYDLNTKKWILDKDVSTNLVGQIRHEKYGYKNRDDVKLKFVMPTDNKIMGKVFKNLQKNNFKSAVVGFENLGLSANVARTA